MNAAIGELPPTIEPVKFSPGLIAKFWLKIDKGGPLPDQSNPHYAGLDQCWNWISAKHAKDGYGRFWHNNLRWLAHRMAWMVSHGPVPNHQYVLHRCDNTLCCNPAHLFLGTRTENNHDRDRKGRARALSGDQSFSRQHPERLSRGDSHYARTSPEKLARGDRSGARLHPELVKRGEQNGQAKLTASQVVEIRQRRASGCETLAALGREFNVHTSTIGLIVRRKKWAHLP